MSETPFGPYVLIEQIGVGGMAEVWLARKARPLGFERRFAIKRILPSLAANREFVAMFIDEARLAAHLSHPNIVQVFDFGEVEGQLYLAMEYIAGLTANALLRTVARRREQVPFAFASYIVCQALDALHFAHNARDERGRTLHIVHRDVSPANILLGHDGIVKLGDFGIARAQLGGKETQAGQLKGKLGYMSPEQVLGGPLDARSDVFSAATVLAELLLGRALFGGGSELDVLLRIRDADTSVLWERAEVVGREVLDVLGGALTADPGARYANAAEFAAALRALMRRRGHHPDAGTLAEYLHTVGLFARRVSEPTPTPVTHDERPAPSAAAAADAVDIFLDPEADEPADRVEAPTAAARPPSSAQAAARYTIRMPDGAEYGPVSYPRLVEFLTTGQIDGDTPVSDSGAPYVPARRLVELSRFVTSPALQWDPSEIEGADLEGEIAQVSVPRLFFRIVSGRETGVLHLRDGRRRKKVYFVEGHPEFVASTDRGELLGEHLVKSGQCLRMEVDMALAMLPRFGGHLGDALVGLGVMRPMTLFRAMTEQVRERLVEIFRWRTGSFAYARGRRSHEETFPINVDPYALITDAVERSYTPSELEAALRSYAERVLAHHRSPLVTADKFSLPPRVAHVLAAIDGRVTLTALLARMSMSGEADPDEVLRAVFLGLCCDLIEARESG